MPEPPAPSPRRAAWRRWLGAARPALEAAAIGTTLGLIDVHSDRTGPWWFLVYFAVGAVEGVRHAGRAWQCWVPLGMSMYLAHVVAIGFGYRPPFVEEDAAAARQGLILFYPASSGLILGAGVRFGLAALGFFPRKDGPPVRLVPQSIRGLFGTVAGVAVFLFAIRWLAADATTVYAPGFNSRLFAEVRTGDTAEQVRAKLGPPIQAHGRTPHDSVWAYSLGASESSNYKRYWIIFDRDKVAFVIDDYWWD